MECDAEHLISLVEKRRAIYDVTSKEYNNRSIVDRMWQEIADEMGKSGKHEWINTAKSFQSLASARNFVQWFYTSLCTMYGVSSNSIAQIKPQFLGTILGCFDLKLPTKDVQKLGDIVTPLSTN